MPTVAAAGDPLAPMIRWPAGGSGDGGAGDGWTDDAWTGGVIVASPHSGRDYPAWFMAESTLDPRVLRSSEDAFVDLLIEPALAAGAVLLSARAPRCLVDVNRAATDLDPQAIDGVPRRAPDPRIQSGLGVIPRVVSRGRAIRTGRLSRAEAERRIDRYWRPYHAALAALMDRAHAGRGRAVLIDVHSMPHEAVAPLGPSAPQIVVGDLNGRAAGRELRDQVLGALGRQGFRVAVNAPFAGAHIAATHGRPAEGRHVLQLEIDRALYMDEGGIAPHAGYAAFAERFGAALCAIVREADGGARGERALAAE